MSVKLIIGRNKTIILTYVVAIALLAFISIIRPGYASPNNLKVLEALAAILGITALGQTFVILTGGMDLSIPWMLTVSAFLVGGITQGNDEKLLIAIPIVLIVGGIMGLFNGIGVAYIGIAPVIMTMASNIIFQGMLVGITGGAPGAAPPEMLQNFSMSSTMGLSGIFVFWILLSVIALWVLHKTAYGRKLYAVGNNPTAARFSGVHDKRITLSAYCICGVMAALAGVLYAGRLGQMYLGMGDEYQMESISAVAIGGIALVGGSGSYAGTIAGVFILVVLNGLLSAINIPMSMQKIIYGVVLFLAVLISSKRKNTK